MFGKQIDKLVEVDPFKIKLNDDEHSEDSYFKNARQNINPEEMATNRESIRKIGLLKPIMIRPIKDDLYEYQIICGSRRFRNILKLLKEANKIIKEGHQPTTEELCWNSEKAEWMLAIQVYNPLKCLIRDCDDETAVRINIAENLEHAKVPEIDLMNYCQYLIDLKKEGKPRFTRKQISDMINRGESWISQTLNLNKLPEHIKELMREERITRTAALSLLNTKKEKIEEVIEISEKIVREEKLTEIKTIDNEIFKVNLELEDAVADVELYKLMENEDLKEIAERKVGACKKRVTGMSEKRDSCIKELDKPQLTGITIDKANLIVTEAKKGASKLISPRSIKEIYSGFKEYKKKSQEEVWILDVISDIFEIILGNCIEKSVEDIIKSRKK